MSQDEYLATRLQEALAADERVSQLDITVRIHDNEVTLSGTVSTEARKRAATFVSEEVLPNHMILNELRVVQLSGSETMSDEPCIRIAAVGDVHYGLDSAGQLRHCITNIHAEADALLLAGDLTRHGTPGEVHVLASDLRGCSIPIVAVLGNHDHQSDAQDEITEILLDAGVRVLEGTSTRFTVGDTTVGIAGTKGFGGGFAGACGSEFGERIQKDFIAHSRDLANSLGKALADLDTDIRIALTHFSPTADTLRGEPLEIYPWLGSYFLAEAIDENFCDWAFHGHAHAGTECGTTPGGVQVRNVAQPVIQHAYKVYAIRSRARNFA